MISDGHARSAALEPNRSFIVQAPAGSGKTGLLVYRMLTLLATVEQPQQVLAITFTRKATAEMRARLLELMQAAERDERSEEVFEQQGIDLAKRVLVRDEQLGWSLLNAPHQLQIQTIDAFCAKLTASMPWLSRLGDRPRTTDQADVHYAAAVESLLSELLNPDSVISDALQTVLLELDFNYNKARQLFSSMLAKRDQWLRHLLRHNLASLRNELEQAWQVVVDEQITQLQTELSDGTIEQLVDLAAYAAQNIKPKENQVSMLAPFETFEHQDQDIRFSSKQLSLSHWQSLCRLLLVSNGKSFRKTVTIAQGFVAKSAEKTRLLELLSEFAGDESLRALINDVLQLPTPHFSDQDWQQLQALEVVLKALAAFLQLRFRSVGECDHSEVTQRANLALQELDNPTDLALRMDYQLQHILVDEFQDTSNGQIELLKKLTLGWSQQDSGATRTLFLVGDPMQSIYRFREADVSLFLQVANNAQTHVFENLEIESLQLTENFRSAHSMVEWFNQTFEQSFPADNNVLTGAIKYAHAESNKTAIQGEIVCQLAHSKEQEARLMVDQVQQTLDELSSPSDKIAILVRSRGQLTTLIPALQEAGIPYLGVDIQPLKEMQAVIDVVALCKAICREDDRIAWFALLRGPWCGLSLTEIKQLSKQQDKTIWQQISSAEALRSLGVDSSQRLTRFVNIMRSTIQQRQQVDLGALARWAWRGLGGELTLMGASFEDIETVFHLIDGLQRGGDLPSMLELEKALDGIYAQPTSLNEQANKVQVVISTMHKSKGLQYDTVILPGLSNRPRVDERDILMWAEHQNKSGQSNLLLAPLRMASDEGGHFDYLRKLEGKRAANESVRLMYVAATRAERKLVLLAKGVQDEETGEIKAPASSSLLATCWEAIHQNCHFPLEPEELEGDSVLSQDLYRLGSDYQTQYPSSVAWQVEQQLNAQGSDELDLFSEEESEISKQFDWATTAATGVGTVLHRWLQYNDKYVFQTQVDDQLLNTWRTELIALRVPDTQIEYAIRNLRSAIDNIKADTQARFIFQDYEVEQNEYALSVYDNGVVKKFIIDRTFVDENNVRWIIDYKSTPTKNKDLYAFAKEQVELRHKTQLEHYGQLMRQIDDREIQLAVYFPLIKQLITWPYQG